MSGAYKKVTKANQRVHRERSQPAHRAKFGLLEKKKDYVERAQEHHKKRDKIKALRKKAADRNPDEFYFNMVSTEKVDGVHKLRKEKEETETEEQKLLLDRKDLRYVSLKRTMELKKIEKLKGELGFLDPQFRQNKHTVFVDTEDEVSGANARLAKLREENSRLLSITPQQQEEMEKKYGQLAKRLQRLKELTTVQQKLEVSMHLTKDKGGKKKLVKEETKESAAVYRWCFKRKR